MCLNPLYRNQSKQLFCQYVLMPCQIVQQIYLKHYDIYRPLYKLI